MDLDNIVESQYELLFWEILNKETRHLYKNSKEYINISHRCVDILNKYPNVQLVLEEEKPIILTEEEMTALIEYKQLDKERYILEEKQMLYAGSRNAYYILKKIGLLKDEESD